MTAQTIELQEYRTANLPAEAIPQHVGQRIWSQYQEKITVEPPTFKTENQWRLTPQGWAGHIPVDDEFNVFIQPKVELDNLFRMLEYAYRLPFIVTGDIVGADSLQELYERLARILALRVLDRGRKGFYREYASRSNKLPYVRGKVMLESMLRTPWDVSLDCQYHENTSDVEDNQILAWTLFCIARTGLCRDDVARLIRRAFRATQGIAQLKPCSGNICDGRTYNRLNEDYAPLHALCRFFLDHSGPSHKRGGRSMLPFLIDMARLYELFVAEWLRVHLPENIILKDQATVRLGGEHKVEFRIDLLLTDRNTGSPLCLLDTKYKAPTSPGAGDVEQVIAYAKTLRCPEAVLVYPQDLPKPFDDMVGGDIHVWTTTFGLTGDLEQSGRAFMHRLLDVVYSHPCPPLETERVFYIDIETTSFANIEELPESEDEPSEESEESEGWRKAPYSFESILSRYSHIWLAQGYKLAGYQFCSGMGSNGFPFVIPMNSELPDPSEDELDFGWLKTGEATLTGGSSLPDWMNPHVSKAIRGDRTPLSYLEASLCVRALREMGARWHGIHWGTHQLISSQRLANEILSSGDEQGEWDWPNGKPREWRPFVCKRRNGSVMVEFFTYSELGQQAIYLHRDVYTSGYDFESQQEAVGIGGYGFVF